MKKIAWYLILIVFCFTGCMKPQVKNPIEGAWKLVYMKAETDSIIYEFPGNTTADVTKMWIGDHFSVVGRLMSDSLVIKQYVGGTYTIDGEIYIENVAYHSFPESEGQSAKMHLVIKNDTLTQIWPLKENNEPAENAYVEKYVRYQN